MKSEPAVVITAAVAFVGALITLLVAFGIDINEAQKEAIIGCLVSFCALLLLLGPIIRQFVWSPRSVEKIRAAAIKAGQTDSAAPPVVP